MSRQLWSIALDDYFPKKPKIRSEHTRDQYRFAINDFAEMLGRAPELADLTDDSLAALTTFLLDKGLAEITTNERVGRLKTLWTWLAKRGVLKYFPTVERVPIPERIPRAWNVEEMQALFAAFAAEPGSMCGVPAPAWWFTCHAWLWNTGERRGATFGVTFDMLDLKRGVAVLPPEIRKGRRKAAVYYLWPDVVELIKEIRSPRRELVWPWPYHIGTFYHHYARILKRAGLPDGRHNKTQAMRVSHATWLHALGHDATAALGHGSPETTRKSYLDVRLIRPKDVALFRPWETNGTK